MEEKEEELLFPLWVIVFCILRTVGANGLCNTGYYPGLFVT
jgi:hypothetical protein